MRRFFRIWGTILILMLLAAMAFGSVSAKTLEPGASGKGQNPFTPRGYLVDTGEGKHWLSSPFNNNGTKVTYSGVQNGVDYLEAKKEDGSDYTFYAMTDRNPNPGAGKIGAGRIYLFAYKDGQRISNFTSYVNPTPTRDPEVDPSGNGTCWSLRIQGLKLDPGCRYEFGFLRGMQANNGITLVLAENEEGYACGYIQETSEGLTKEEQKRYKQQKDQEYEFISSWSKRPDGKGYDVNRVPMRFSLQTYADLSKWEKAEKNARNFLASVTTQDLKQGKYRRENIRGLKNLLDQLNREAEKEVKKKRQPEADRLMASMIKELQDMLEKAKSEKPEKTDLTKLKAVLKEARSLYRKAAENTGIEVGQYGRIEVETLGEEIKLAASLDPFSPQREINEQIRALEYAMTEVKASLVQEEQRVFYDKVTGIYVIAAADALPEEAKLFVRRMGRETPDYKASAKYLSSEETEAVFYKMQFYQGDRITQPNKSVEIQMPIDDSISRSSSTVYQVGEKGQLKKIKSLRAEDTRIFKQKNLTSFVMAGSAATEEEKAEARNQRMKALMAQKRDKDGTDKDNQLKQKQEKKEQYKDPLNYMMRQNRSNASFSSDIMQETDPVYVIYLAALLAVCAAAMGIRGLQAERKRTLADHADHVKRRFL